ncbi:hypothetical protein ANO11243_043700 [Dothideomycetidae sp. 11243]|nr:hypothetical protein ANO11243_043700 [fungal sp. No.11243]
MVKGTRTVTDLAKFIARAATHPQPASTCAIDSWTRSAASYLDRLLVHPGLGKHAPELIEVVTDVKRDVYLLDTLPLVLNHVDLAPTNIFTNDDGTFTNVIDWDGARIEAFGMSLWSLYEYFIDARTSNSVYEQVLEDGRTVRETLEQAFWRQLWESTSGALSLTDAPAIRASAMVGAVFRYLDEDNLDEIEESGGDSLARAKMFIPSIHAMKIVESQVEGH